MFRNYCKIAWRNLLKHRTFSIINIAGLSFSVAFCLLVFFYIRHEQSYDAFHANGNRLFRLEMTNLFPPVEPKAKAQLFCFLTKNDEVENELTIPLKVGPDLQATFPEVKSMTRFQNQGDQLVKVGNQVYKEKDIIYADYNFFNTFSFPLEKGNPATAFNAPQNIILSKNTAEKYFGSKDPIGQQITLLGDSSRLFTVSGIAGNAPSNSSIQFNIVLPLVQDPNYEENIQQGFNQSSHLLMVELARGVVPDQFAKKMNEWVKKYYTEPFVTGFSKDNKTFDIKKFQWYLRPLADCHYNVSAHKLWGHYTNETNLYQLACLVIIILLIASLNYILIVISNSAARSQEVGIRKVMGANRRSVIMQFWIETQIVVAIAVLLGFVLTRPFLPLFNKMIGSSLAFTSLSWKEIIPALLLLCLALGVLAGYYPALILSRMKPVTIIKSFSTFKINPRFSRILIVLQYTSCVVLMIAAFVINRQMHYINSKDLGFDKEQVLMVSNPTFDAVLTKKVKNRLYAFAQTQPSITSYSGMNGGLTGAYNTSGLRLNGEQKWRRVLTVDYNYFEMMGLKFVQGRPFSTAFADTARKERAIVVNETLFNMLGTSAKLGQFNEPLNAKIIGVVKDYNFESLSKKIEPEEHRLSNGYLGYFMFKIKAGQMQPTIAAIAREWKTITGNYPFEYTFLDDTIAQMYEPEMRWQKTIQASCFFAIFIACMGLFGLSAINAVNRMKEIGIRKILGASVQDIVRTLSADFVLMVALSVLIAIPIAWWIMNRWLEDFAYRVHLSWWMFAVVGIAALAIALTTTCIQSVKAAMANPVDSLRTE